MKSFLARAGVIILLVVWAQLADAVSIATVFLTGPEFRVDNESLLSGHASAELGGGGTEGAGSFSYVGSAYADTARGALGVAATATGSGYDVSSDRIVIHSQAEFADVLTFSTDGTVTIRLAVQGSFASVFRGQMTSNAELFVAGMGATQTASTFWRGGHSVLNVSTRERVISDLPSNYVVWLGVYVHRDCCRADAGGCVP